jgi:hypothetical protein
LHDKGLRPSFVRFDRFQALRQASAAIDRAVTAAVCRMTRTLLTMLASATIDNARERVRARLASAFWQQGGPADPA